MVAGAPNVSSCGDDINAWASESSSGVDWLEVSYIVPVVPTEINIYESYNPHQIVKVEVLDTASTYHTVYTGDPQAVDTCPYIFTVEVRNADYQAVAVKISIDQSVLGTSWNEIDAVELVGMGDAALLPTAAPGTPEPTVAIQPTPLGGKPPAGFVWRLSRQPGDLFYAGAGLTIGPDGNIYFVDALARFHVISPDGELLKTVEDYDHMFVTADIDVGPDGNLYIADWGSDNYPIIVYATDGTFIRAWGSKGKDNGQFGDYSPDYLAVCNSQVFVVDKNKDASDNDIERVQVFDLQGNFVRLWSITDVESSFSTNGIACGPDGNIYLVGFMSDKLLSFSPDGKSLGQVGDGALSGATPSSLAMDAAGNFYVGTWNNGILKLDSQGKQLAQWGTSTDDDGPRAEGVFKFPDAIVVDNEGNVYVADWSGEYSYVTKFVFP
jgi:sugar lactone lactonase YvrE